LEIKDLDGRRYKIREKSGPMDMLFRRLLAFEYIGRLAILVTVGLHRKSRKPFVRFVPCAQQGGAVFQK
jgi:hypothetical protein